MIEDTGRPGISRRRLLAGAGTAGPARRRERDGPGLHCAHMNRVLSDLGELNLSRFPPRGASRPASSTRPRGPVIAR